MMTFYTSVQNKFISANDIIFTLRANSKNKVWEKLKSKVTN